MEPRIQEPEDASCGDDTEREELFSTVYGDDPGHEEVTLLVRDNNETGNT